MWMTIISDSNEHMSAGACQALNNAPTDPWPHAMRQVCTFLVADPMIA
jgi:hypothetical protein